MTESRMREVAVASLGLDKTTGAPVVILKEKDGERFLPIWIGPGEASAIAMELAGVQFTRPLTHDLFNAVVRGLDSTFVRVLITKVVDNTYYASLVFQREDEFISIDARPSDSIALALRAGVPIHAAESLLDASAFEVEETGVADGEAPSPGTGPSRALEEPLSDYLKGLDPEDFGRFEP
ncbi:MAG: bifunctional nuclease family protein [Gemmatimonadales bacterium]|nr:bifunctional nuclease family protein [Gemmatimonadales bacterium]MYG49864.1 bifunctional nuclease family protein [Gemmatimonadales bacterium]MYK03010.1 bifunctional nuclease family protein [Candidatus Palauibacter ramosifaciens]